ncbi:peptidoglycan-binding protein LysM [Qipengyuania nanhaisediminis]
MAAIGAALAGLGLTTLPAAAQGSADGDRGEVIYTVERDDTLYGIADKYLVNDAAALELARHNRIRNPRRLPIARTLRIPNALLRFAEVELEVDSFSGPVTLDGAVPTVGTRLREGTLVRTGRNGFVTFGARQRFGGRISLPSNTSARLLRARRYVLGNRLDVDFQVTRGRATATSPRLEGEDRLRMRTPLAVTAVRGTEFRIAYDPEAGDVSLTEVTEGNVAVAAGGEERAAPAGFGIASSAAGVSAPEALLPSPGFEDPGAIQTGEALEFTLEPVSGATGYRVQLARDASFLDVINEQLTGDVTARFDGLDNGRYFVRARAISASGLEGLSDAYSFRRKRLGVAAEAGPAGDDDSYRFAWRGAGDGASSYAFQLWRDGEQAMMLVDEIGLSTTAIALSNLSAGRYKWRVAIAQGDEEEGLLKVWGPAQVLVVTE